MGGMISRRFVLLAISVTAVLAACGGDEESGGDAPDGAAETGGSQAGEETAEETVAVPEIVLPETVPHDEPVTIEVENGTFTSVEVAGEQGSLGGTADGTLWFSANTPLPGASYDVSAEATDSGGAAHELTGSFTVAEVPDGERLTLSVVRGGGEIVGVGTPIIVKFDQAVDDPAAIEEAMHVASDPQVVGAWYWISPREVHFRPEKYWPAHTSIHVDLELNGVRVGENLWGGRNYDFDVEVGDERIARVDASTQTFNLIRNGETVASWPTSLGAPEFATRNGTYVVQSKDAEYQMTSCSVDIACDESDPEYYDILTKSAVRLTNSGTFIHSAPWSESAQGESNVSHGCLNLSEERARTYFEQAQYGDVVEVSGSTRGAEDLVDVADPGMVDWNREFSELLTLSATGEFTTDTL